MAQVLKKPGSVGLFRRARRGGGAPAAHQPPDQESEVEPADDEHERRARHAQQAVRKRQLVQNRVGELRGRVFLVG